MYRSLFDERDIAKMRDENIDLYSFWKIKINPFF